MKVSYTDIPLGDGNISFLFDAKHWTISMGTGTDIVDATLRGDSIYDLRRFLARMSAAMDVAGFGDLEPPE